MRRQALRVHGPREGVLGSSQGSSRADDDTTDRPIVRGHLSSMTVRLGFDARVLCRQELRGIGTYTVHLLRALRSIRPEWQFVFFADRPITNPSWSEGAEVVVRGPERGSRWHVWERAGLPWHASRAHISLLHSPANVVPEWTSMPRVVTIHDVIPYVPEAADASVAARDLGAAARAARRATAVITDSE